jgi:hypothetical protein
MAGNVLNLAINLLDTSLNVLLRNHKPATSGLTSDQTQTQTQTQNQNQNAPEIGRRNVGAQQVGPHLRSTESQRMGVVANQTPLQEVCPRLSSTTKPSTDGGRNASIRGGSCRAVLL